MNPQIQTMLQQAIKDFQLGYLKKAEAMLSHCAQLDAKNFDILHLLAIVYASQEMHQFAIECYKKALQLSPNDVSALSNLGSSLNAIGRNQEAFSVFQKAIMIDPEASITWYNAANILCDTGEYKEALTYYERSIKLNPQYYQTYINYGKVLFELKRYSDSLTFYDKALRINQNSLECLINKGTTLNELKRFDEAIAHFDKVLSLKPDFAEGWSNKGIALNGLKRYDDAISHYDKALSFKPDYAEGWSNKGVTLHELKRYDEAIAHYDKALSLKPDYAVGWSNKGFALNELKRFDEAIDYYDKALSLKPDDHEASWNKSLTLLLQGDFENGFPLYESRWYSEKISAIVGKRFFDKPLWLGVESLQGKTILLYGEQGLGDFIQFARYAKLVADLGAKVILEVPQPLAGLMKDLEGVSELVIKGQELPFFDYQCPLLSLPLAFNTNISSIPAHIPYLASSAHQVGEWSIKLGEKRNKRVGLVWSSMSSFKQDSKRSLLLADFIRALPLENFEYVCLQKELKECDKEFFRSYQNIRFFGDELRDFSDTAALIENLDLVISTCTSVPHLSAALGKETWVLLSYVPDWRWLLDRDDSPWYPAMKLYRQTSIGDWNSVLDRVKSDLSSNKDF